MADVTGDVIRVLSELDLVQASSDGGITPRVRLSVDTNGNTVLMGPDGAISVGGLGTRKAALLGDSIASQNIEASSGYTYYRGKGWMTWAQMLLGFPWDIQFSDNFAIAGTSHSAMITGQLPLLRAANSTLSYERCFISSGTNDSNGGTSLSTMISEAQTLIEGIADMGIIPVHIGILPRGNDGAMTDAKRKNLRFNDWLANYAAKTGVLEFIPGAHEAVANNATAFGNAITTMMDVGVLHPYDNGSYFIGKAIADYYTGRGFPTTLNFAQSQADQYNATYNQSGVVFDTPNPLMLGGVTAPTGMTSAGGTGPYVTWAVGTRTLDNGQTRPTVVATINNATGSTQSGGYLYDDNLASGAWDTEEIAEGDVIYAQAIVEITTGGAGIRPYLELNENDGTTQKVVSCGAYDSAEIGTIPDGTILVLRTPNHTVRAYSGSGNASAYARLAIRCPNGSSGVITVRAFEMRKVVE